MIGVLTEPSDIVLGPPKPSFASSAAMRSPNRPLESPGRSAFGSFGGEAAKADYFGRGRPNADRDVQDGPRTGPHATSRNGRSEGDPWSNGRRSARNFGDRDDRTSRRGCDSASNNERSEGQDGRRGPQRVSDGQAPDSNRFSEGRRNGIRSASKPSWYQDNEPSDPHPHGEGNRNRDWREAGRGNYRGGDRDWSKDSKLEQDPEWLMDARSEEKKEKHTVQDIEQWKASMKAQELEQQGQMRTASSGSSDRTHCGSHASKSKFGVPLTLDRGVDDFFTMWGEAKAGNGLKPAEEAFKSDSARLAPKSSRFTDFFSPQPALTPSNPEPPATSFQNAPSPRLEPQQVANDDKVGFERMIQQLRSQKPMNLSSPPVGTIENAKPSRSTPPPEQTGPLPSPSPPIISPRSRKSHQLENILGLQSPLEAPATMNRDSEFLLNLMRQDPGLQHVLPPEYQKNPVGNLPENVSASGYISPPSFGSHSGQDEGVTRPHFYEEHPAEAGRSFDKLNPNASGALHQHPRPHFDRPNDGGPLSTSHMHMGMLPPPGLGRPMQPGPFSPFGPQQQPSLPLQPGGRMVGPPPGFPGQVPSVKQQQQHQQQPFPHSLPPLANLHLGTDHASFGIPGIGTGPMPGPELSPGANPPYVDSLLPPHGGSMPPQFSSHPGYPPLGANGNGPVQFGLPGGRASGPNGPPGGMNLYGEYGNGAGRAGGGAGLLGRKPD